MFFNAMLCCRLVQSASRRQNDLLPGEVPGMACAYGVWPHGAHTTLSAGKRLAGARAPDSLIGAQGVLL